MNKITFPALNLEFNINRAAFTFLGIDIMWYALIIISAAIIALHLASRDNGKYNIKFDTILNLFIYILPVAIICGRLYYVLFSLDYYKQYPEQIINLRQGGIAIYGVIIGGLIVIAIYCLKKKVKFLNILDYIVPYLAFAQSIGRWGNFVNCEAYGTITNSFLRMGIIEGGKYIEVHPTFLYESICTLIIFVLLYLYRKKRKYVGEITYMYFGMYALARSIIEGIRTDSLMLGRFRISQLLSIGIVIFCVVMLIINRKKRDEITDE